MNPSERIPIGDRVTIYQRGKKKGAPISGAMVSTCGSP